jgi:hypothetical protein
MRQYKYISKWGTLGYSIFTPEKKLLYLLVKRMNVLPHPSAGKGAVKIKIYLRDFNMSVEGSYSMTPCSFVVSEGPKFTYSSLNMGVI